MCGEGKTNRERILGRRTVQVNELEIGRTAFAENSFVHAFSVHWGFITGRSPECESECYVKHDRMDCPPPNSEQQHDRRTLGYVVFFKFSIAVLVTMFGPRCPSSSSLSDISMRVLRKQVLARPTILSLSNKDSLAFLTKDLRTSNKTFLLDD